MAGGSERAERPSFAELEALVAEQAVVIAELRAQVAELRGRLGQSSRNSSRPPSRLLLAQIADGALDFQLPALAQAIDARLHLLHTVRSVTALAMLNVGDRVRINHHARPRYLHGVQGTILDLDERTATICIHRPVGRFTSGEIRCPPLALDRLNPGT